MPENSASPVLSEKALSHSQAHSWSQCFRYIAFLLIAHIHVVAYTTSLHKNYWSTIWTFRLTKKLKSSARVKQTIIGISPALSQSGSSSQAPSHDPLLDRKKIKRPLSISCTMSAERFWAPLFERMKISRAHNIFVCDHDQYKADRWSIIARW